MKTTLTEPLLLLPCIITTCCLLLSPSSTIMTIIIYHPLTRTRTRTGVRESSSVDRIKANHRRIMLINHPDRGGSPYLTTKINEAKDLLVKGRGK